MYDLTSDRQARRSTIMLASQNKEIWAKVTTLNGRGVSHTRNKVFLSLPETLEPQKCTGAERRERHERDWEMRGRCERSEDPRERQVRCTKERERKERRFYLALLRRRVVTCSPYSGTTASPFGLTFRRHLGGILGTTASPFGFTLSKFSNITNGNTTCYIDNSPFWQKSTLW